MAARLTLLLLPGAAAFCQPRPPTLRHLVSETQRALGTSYANLATYANGRERDGTWIKPELPRVQRALRNTALASHATRSAFLETVEAVEDTMRASYRRYGESLDGGSTGWTDWLDNKQADGLKEQLTELHVRPLGQGMGLVEDTEESEEAEVRRRAKAAVQWGAWLLGSPEVISLNLGKRLNASNAEARLGDDVAHRFLLHLHVLPPNKALAVTKHPPGSVILFRTLSGSIRTEKLIKGVGTDLRPAVSTTLGTGTQENPALLTSFGGPWRSVECDGDEPALVLELILLPPQFEGDTRAFPRLEDVDADPPLAFEPPDDIADIFCSADEKAEMERRLWPQLQAEEELRDELKRTVDAKKGMGEKPARLPSLRQVRDGVGGLDRELEEIYRRVMLPRSMSQELRQALNIQPVKGLMLYGPPGCGKTALARCLTDALQAESLEIINGPELLSKWTGESESRMRDLFRAEDKEGLHVIVFDEIDAITSKRGMQQDGGARDGVVNTLLANMDGVKQLEKVIIIGMTNRMDMIDPALLRPGRFEVQIEVRLPSAQGRLDILEIHTKQLRAQGVISEEAEQLLKNFVATEPKAPEEAPEEMGLGARVVQKLRFWEEPQVEEKEEPAPEGMGMSGADIAGLVREVTSFALERCLLSGGDAFEGVIADDAFDNFQVIDEDVRKALATRQ